MRLVTGIPARDAALDRGYVSAALRAALAAQGCAVHTPPKRGMAEPPPWDKAIYARRHLIENDFSRLKDWARTALRRDKTHRSWMGFAHLAATILNLRVAKSGHRLSTRRILVPRWAAGLLPSGAGRFSIALRPRCMARKQPRRASRAIPRQIM